MNVLVGSYQDPEEVPGLAHFTEHMIFMGSKKYPGVNECNDFISSHGGYLNAYTDSENTNYYFSIISSYLNEALDRFSKFFICPLFSQFYIEKEINAIESEFIDSFKKSSFKSYHVLNKVFDPKHPACKFSMGSKTTLNISDIRNRLIQFYENYYSSNRMGLVVLGQYSVDELESMVREHFIAVPCRPIKAHNYKKSPYPPKYVPKQVIVNVSEDVNDISLNFVCPPDDFLYESMPSYVITHLLTSKYSGSLSNYLEKSGCAKSISVSRPISTYHFNLISIRANSTSQKNAMKFVNVFFAYINMLKMESQGIPKHVFDELTLSLNLKFHYEQCTDLLEYVKKLAVKLFRKFRNEDILVANNLLLSDPRKAFYKYLHYFNPENVVVVRTRQIPKSIKLNMEAYYRTEYTVLEISEKVRGDWSKAFIALFSLPPKNLFSTTHFSIYGVRKDSSEFPKRHSISKGIDLWHKLDDTFLEPYTCFNFLITKSKDNETIVEYLASQIFVRAFKANFTDLLWSASNTGLLFSLNYTSKGLVLEFSGFSQMLVKFVAILTRKLAQFDLDEQFLKRVLLHYSQNITRYENLESTLLVGKIFRSYFAEDTMYTHEELCQTARTIDVACMKSFWNKFKKNLLSIEAFAYGNITLDSAKSIASIMIGNMFGNDYAFEAPLQPKCSAVELQDGEKHLVVHPKEVESRNCAVKYYLQFGPASNHSLYSLSSIFVQAFESFIFKELRTEKQLGYLVSLDMDVTNEIVGAMVDVQSNVASPVALELQISECLDSLLKRAKEMSEEDWNKCAETFKSQLMMKPKSMKAESITYWNEIKKGSCDFSKNERVLSNLVSISKDLLVEFVTERVCINGKRKKSASFHAWSKKYRGMIKTSYDRSVCWWDPGKSNYKKESIKNCESAQKHPQLSPATTAGSEVLIYIEPEHENPQSLLASTSGSDIAIFIESEQENSQSPLISTIRSEAWLLLFKHLNSICHFFFLVLVLVLAPSILSF